jgi:hypothetical protein
MRASGDTSTDVVPSDHGFLKSSLSGSPLDWTFIRRSLFPQTTTEPPMEAKLKHLEFIQNVITRMNANSFLLKGWAVTLVSALFALAAKDANHHYVYPACIAIPMFWILDAFFLSQERQYRGLYAHVTTLLEAAIDFNMNAQTYATGKNRWVPTAFSRTLVIFYFTLSGLSLLVTLLLSLGRHS